MSQVYSCHGKLLIGKRSILPGGSPASLFTGGFAHYFDRLAHNR
jgi:hypothetical protein